ncbi:MAG: UDP-3-O-acyl-N-acetylglucosamine deacetylase [Pseudomonadota bacterium]
MQKTLTSDVVLTGVGLHSGKAVEMRISPAPVETGIWFRRTDVTGQDPYIAARWNLAQHSPLCTKLVNQDGVSISTVEHIMAGLAGCGINNALVELNGPEVPILDGSAHGFVTAILQAGVIEQAAAVRAIQVVNPVRVSNGDAWAELVPSDALTMDFEIDFSDAAIGHQKKSMALANGAFVHELCDSRTFCRNADVEQMRANGLALGGTLANAVVVEGSQVLSPGGLRHKDEAVRHKMLDALGDLSLAGAPILGGYTAYKGGHTLTNQLLCALFDAPDAYRFVTCDASTVARLPGADVTASDVRRLA